MPRITLSDNDRAAEIAADVYFEAYRSYSVDQLLCHPAVAIALCDAVRARTGNPALEDFDILWGLMGRRKRGRLQPSAAGRRRKAVRASPSATKARD